MVSCWSAAASAQCWGDAGSLSDAFTSVDVYIPKSSAPFPNISGAALSTLLKWSWFRKNAELRCDLYNLVFLSASWESNAHLRAQGAFGFGGERCYCLNAVTHTFNDSFRRQWACDKQGNSKGKDVVNLKAWGSISPASITCCCMKKMVFHNP